MKLTNEHLKVETENIRQSLRNALKSLDTLPTLESIRDDTCEVFSPLELISELATFQCGLVAAAIQEHPEVA